MTWFVMVLLIVAGVLLLAGFVIAFYGGKRK